MYVYMCAYIHGVRACCALHAFSMIPLNILPNFMDCVYCLGLLSPNIASESFIVRRFNKRAKRTIIIIIITCSRHCVATNLATIINEVCASGEVEAWDRLFRFLSRCLQALRRGGHCQIVAS